MKQRALLIFATSLVACLYLSSNGVRAGTAGLKTYTAPIGAKSQPSVKPQQHFDCSEQIYTVLEMQDYPVGRYQLDVKWIDPAKNIRERTQYPFSVGASGDTKLWAWLALSRAPGAGMIAWLNPAAGLEEFVGTWDVEVKIDNRLVSTLHFDVVC